MRTSLIFGLGVAFVAFLSSSHESKGSEETSAYSHGETTCLQGDEGPGVRLRLRQNSRCEGRVSYPYLEIDIRELPIVVHKKIAIGEDNWAFRCPDPEESCEQSLGGTIVFDHFEQTPGKHIQTDGSYDMQFRTGRENGHFKVDCVAPCG